MSEIESFLNFYEGERSHLTRLTEHATSICKDGLADIGVMGNTTGRVKEGRSLKKKLEKQGVLPSQEFISNSGLDFVGLRISLYFPNQKRDVVNMLKRRFHFQRTREFKRKWQPPESGPYENIFGQYSADHIWVRLREDDMDRDEAGKYSAIQFEIQLRSVLMDAWAAISHDLQYKALSGNLSVRELKLLDGLKGHVEVGEIMLGELHRVHRKRIDTGGEPVQTVQDLVEVILDSVPEDQIFEVQLGDLDDLLSGLQIAGRDTPHLIRERVPKLDHHSGAKNTLKHELEKWQERFHPAPATLSLYLLEGLLRDIIYKDIEQLDAPRDIEGPLGGGGPWYERYWQPLLWLSRELLLDSSMTPNHDNDDDDNYNTPDPKKNSSNNNNNNSPAARKLEAQIRTYAHLWCTSFHFSAIPGGSSLAVSPDDCFIDCRQATAGEAATTTTTTIGQNSPSSSAPGFDLIARLAVLGLGPKYEEDDNEKDQSQDQDRDFLLIANCMRRTYAAYPRVWKQAIYDYDMPLRRYGSSSPPGSTTYRFLHSVDVALWLLENESDDDDDGRLLARLLIHWPLDDGDDGGYGQQNAVLPGGVECWENI